jgi:hypothetical protein
MKQNYSSHSRLDVACLRIWMVTAITLLALPLSNTSAQAQNSPIKNTIPDVGYAACEGVCASLALSAAASSGATLLVTNASEDFNGDTSNPSALIANPGPDGISLVEAVVASEGTDEFDTIQFDPSMIGAVIHFTNTMLVISHGNLLIDGDIDGDGIPDVTLDGSSRTMDNGFTIYGASHVMIKGMKAQNFRKDGVLIFTRPDNGMTTLEDIVIYQSTFTGNQTAIDLNLGDRTYFTMQSIEIVENIIQDNGSGISVIAGMGGTPTDNVISGVSILANQILDNDASGGVNVALFVSPAASYGASRNHISDLEIRGNHISGHPNSVIIDASNQPHCNNNTTDQVVIADNDIETDYVTIEFVNESGMYSSGNTMSNIVIADNRLTNGGIHFGGATAWAAHDNTTSNVLIERNQIVGGLANGIYMASASGGAYNNHLQNVILRSNFIQNSTDAGILLHATADGSNNTISNVTIINQTLVKNGLTSTWSAGGININSKNASNTITGVTISNSILWGNNLGDSLGGSLVPDLVTHTLLNDSRYLGSHDNFYASPEFVEPASGDYHLQATSSCVDSGEPAGIDIGMMDIDHIARLWDGDGDEVAVVDLGAWEYGAVTVQELNVLREGVAIANGDTIPAPWDGTDFAYGEVSGTSVLRTFTIENSGATTLHLIGDPVIEITGLNAADFRVVTQPVSVLDGGVSISFTIEFLPMDLGLREAIIKIDNDDGDENPFTFAIQGTGIPLPYRVYLPLILAVNY